jgi:hypothetical protein
MIALLVGTLIVAGVWIGWYGYRASLRIAEWGRRMDECDSIFQTVTAGTEKVHYEDGRKRIPKDGPSVMPFGPTPLPH